MKIERQMCTLFPLKLQAISLALRPIRDESPSAFRRD